MDTIIAVTSTVNFLKSLKDAYALAQKLGNQDLRQMIGDIRDQSLEIRGENLLLQQENIELKIENERLRKSLEEKPNIRFGNHHQWEVKGSEIFGPICNTCWETEKRKISMIEAPNNAKLMCPKCRHPISGHTPPKEWNLTWVR